MAGAQKSLQEPSIGVGDFSRAISKSAEVRVPWECATLSASRTELFGLCDSPAILCNVFGRCDGAVCSIRPAGWKSSTKFTRSHNFTAWNVQKLNFEIQIKSLDWHRLLDRPCLKFEYIFFNCPDQRYAKCTARTGYKGTLKQTIGRLNPLISQNVFILWWKKKATRCDWVIIIYDACYFVLSVDASVYSIYARYNRKLRKTIIA